MSLFRLVHLDFDDKKIFDIKEMTSRGVYVNNADLLGSGSRKRWEPAGENDRVNVPKWKRNSSEDDSD